MLNCIKKRNCEIKSHYYLTIFLCWKQASIQLRECDCLFSFRHLFHFDDRIKPNSLHKVAVNESFFYLNQILMSDFKHKQSLNSSQCLVHSFVKPFACSFKKTQGLRPLHTCLQSINIAYFTWIQSSFLLGRTKRTQGTSEHVSTSRNTQPKLL